MGDERGKSKKQRDRNGRLAGLTFSGTELGCFGHSCAALCARADGLSDTQKNVEGERPQKQRDAKMRGGVGWFSWVMFNMFDILCWETTKGNMYFLHLFF